MKKWILLITCLLFGITCQAKEEPKELYAQSAVLMDADSGRVLFSKNGTDKKAMASTTKIMTCILALEQAEEDRVAVFTKNAQKQPKVHLGAAAGEEFYLRDLLYSLMLESHNDTAVAIAETVAGSVEEFADLMNKKAIELGCKDTYFITPNGLDAEDENGVHSTTAVDLARIMSYCIMESPKKDRFLEITQTPNHQFSNLAGTRSYACSNHNSFLSMMPEAISGKTGFTADAGYCYVGAVESEGRTFVVSLLACGWPNNKTYKWKDMKKIATYGMESYEFETFGEKAHFEDIPVVDGIPEDNELFQTASVSVAMKDVGESKILLHNEEQIEKQVTIENELEAPVKKGQQVGSVKYYLGEECIREDEIVATENIDKINFRWYFQQLLEMYIEL